MSFWRVTVTVVLRRGWRHTLHVVEAATAAEAKKKLVEQLDLSSEDARTITVRPDDLKARRAA